MADWGRVDSTDADIMTPGETAGHGRLKAEEFGVAVADVVVYGDLAGLRAWATSLLKRLPADRHGALLVNIDRERQAWWIGQVAPLYDDLDDDEPWTADTYSVESLFEALTADPADAGWYLSGDFTGMWTEMDEGSEADSSPGGLMVGVTLADGLRIGIGQPIRDEDLTPQALCPDLIGSDGVDDHTLAIAALDLIAQRINNAY